VKTIHDRLQLGFLTDTSHSAKNTGYADYTWDYAPYDCQKLCCLVEIKMATRGDTARDIGKFTNDVHEGVKSDRINGAMYVSLVDRIANRPRISMDLVHGVPTMWVCREEEDHISAPALVEMAFGIFANCWPLISGTDEGNVNLTIQKVCKFIKAQMSEYQKLQPRIEALEKASDSIRREINNLKRIKESLIEKAQGFRIHIPGGAPSDGESSDSPVDKEGTGMDPSFLLTRLETAVKDFYKNRARYPKELADLQDLLPLEVVRLAKKEDLDQVNDRVRKINRSAAQKRRRESEG